MSKKLTEIHINKTDENSKIDIVEKQEKRHLDDLNTIRLSFAEEIEDLTEIVSKMSSDMIQLEQNRKDERKNMFDAILEK